MKSRLRKKSQQPIHDWTKERPRRIGGERDGYVEERAGKGVLVYGSSAPERSKSESLPSQVCSCGCSINTFIAAATTDFALDQIAIAERKAATRAGLLLNGRQSLGPHWILFVFPNGQKVNRHNDRNAAVKMVANSFNSNPDDQFAIGVTRRIQEL